MGQDSERLAVRERWERKTAIPLMIAATIQLLTFIWSAGFGVQSPYFSYVDYIVWAMFISDYLVRLQMSKGFRKHFVRTHPLDLLAVLLPAFRFVRVISAIVRMLSVSRRGLSEKVLATTILITTTLWVVAAAAVREAESAAADANIMNFSDSLWWSGVTMTTVGYGDFYPVTWQGRAIAGGLMVTGIAAIGAVTGAAATRLIASHKNSETEEIAELRATVAALEKRGHQAT